MQTINPQEISVQRLHHTLLGAIGPRPIALASTISASGQPNLSPFSFFNAFGVNPTTLIFSPSRRGRDNTLKHTYLNVKAVPEVVINVVTASMVEQVNLSSTEYPSGVDEFAKAGFTPVNAMKIRPLRVKESPVQFECRVREVIETGNQGGAGNLVICEVLMIHLDETVLDEQGAIDPQKLKLVGRLGGAHYCKAFGEAIFTISKPGPKNGMGIDALPDRIRNSSLLTGNDLGKLGGFVNLPDSNDIRATNNLPLVENIFVMYAHDAEACWEQQQLYARQLIARGRVAEAFAVLMRQSGA